MHIPDEAPKLNPWPFIVGDALLFGVAALIASQARGPLAGAPLIVVGALVFLGAVLATIPFLVNYTRKQELALAERQREIAALAQTTAASAEQLSIAVASLHEITEAATKSAKVAEQLPQKLQEKIHEFKEQLNEVSVTENEALSEEVNTLRASETERLESIVTTVRKLCSELARLDAASRKTVTDLNDTLTRFSTSAQQAATEATTAVASMRATAEKSLATAHSSAMSAIEETLSNALTEIDTKLVNLSGQLTAKLDAASLALDQKIAALKTVGADFSGSPRIPSSIPPAEETAPSPSAPASEVPVQTPSPVRPSRVSPVTEAVDSAPASENGREAATAVAAAEPKPRKRLAKRSADENELTLGLEMPARDEFSQIGPEETHSAIAVSTDGLTRLLVTAYIGIGNKLFIRGEGPGLSWEKGAPLQFVSIGKWRWETADATGPIRAKLYKNDETECAALGEITVDPAHQREVTATF